MKFISHFYDLNSNLHKIWKFCLDLNLIWKFKKDLKPHGPNPGGGPPKQWWARPAAAMRGPLIHWAEPTGGSQAMLGRALAAHVPVTTAWLGASRTARHHGGVNSRRWRWQREDALWRWHIGVRAEGDGDGMVSATLTSLRVRLDIG
jgi:hypothetical protein